MLRADLATKGEGKYVYDNSNFKSGHTGINHSVLLTYCLGGRAIGAETLSGDKEKMLAEMGGILEYDIESREELRYNLRRI